MTYSIVALDDETGAVGVAVASKVLAAAAIVPWARAGVGAVATQAWANTTYGPDGLRLLADGIAAADVVRRLTDADADRDHRQIGVVDAHGRAAVHTGTACLPWAGHRVRGAMTAQANIAAGPAVVDALLDAAAPDGAPFAERLVRALAAAQDAGGDRRGRQAAGLLVVEPTTGPLAYPLDLRVDDHHDPIRELSRLLALHRLYTQPTTDADAEPMTAGLAAELRRRLGSLGVAPDRIEAVAVPELAAPDVRQLAGIAPFGVPRPLPDGWDAGWQRTFEAWLTVENLDARLTAPGWIDRRVVAFLRERT